MFSGAWIGTLQGVHHVGPGKLEFQAATIRTSHPAGALATKGSSFRTMENRLAAGLFGMTAKSYAALELRLALSPRTVYS